MFAAQLCTTSFIWWSSAMTSAWPGCTGRYTQATNLSTRGDSCLTQFPMERFLGWLTRRIHGTRHPVVSLLRGALLAECLHLLRATSPSLFPDLAKVWVCDCALTITKIANGREVNVRCPRGDALREGYAGLVDTFADRSLSATERASLAYWVCLFMPRAARCRLTSRRGVSSTACHE